MIKGLVFSFLTCFLGVQLGAQNLAMINARIIVGNGL